METDPLAPKTGVANGLYKILFVYLGLGTLLMGTYVWGVIVLNDRFLGNAKDPNQIGALNLWGSIYDDKPLLYVYYGGFVCATMGYFMNLGHIVQVADRDMPKDIYDSICLWFSIFFISELFWMPGCVSYISHPTDGMWWALFIQLKVSGLAAIMWAWQNVKLAMCSETEAKFNGAKGWPRLGPIGAALFTAHCAILDGCVWSFYFGTDGRFPPISK